MPTKRALGDKRSVYSADQVKIKVLSMKDAELPWRSSGRRGGRLVFRVLEENHSHVAAECDHGVDRVQKSSLR